MNQEKCCEKCDWNKKSIDFDGKLPCYICPCHSSPKEEVSKCCGAEIIISNNLDTNTVNEICSKCGKILSPKVASWVERFDERFVMQSEDWRRTGWTVPYVKTSAKELKSFISSTINEVIKEERATIDKLAKLLEVAKCPENDCDNNGTIACRISDDEWEPQQCQWCYEKKDIINLIKSLS